MVTNILFDVLKEKGRAAQVVYGEVKEALYLLVVQIHGNQVGHACEWAGSGRGMRVYKIII